ncbi:hypothetical protein GCM10020219_039750 [Nonomuraea dietziae]
MDPINDLAADYGLVVVGGRRAGPTRRTYRGRPIVRLGDAGVYSFQAARR